MNSHVILNSCPDTVYLRLEDLQKLLLLRKADLKAFIFKTEMCFVHFAHHTYSGYSTKKWTLICYTFLFVLKSTNDLFTDAQYFIYTF